MMMEMIEGSETSAISFVTPGNYPNENIFYKIISCEENECLTAFNTAIYRSLFQLLCY